MNQEQVEFRLTVESLRAGAATKSSAKNVGTTQRRALAAFRERLAQASNREPTSCLAIGGPFGSGKSHVLHCFQSEALATGFAVSFAAVGAEFPLHNLQLAVRVLANSAKAPNSVGKATRELAAGPPGDHERFTNFAAWGEASGLDPRFLALIHLYAQSPYDEELRLRIVEDFEGKPMLATELKSRLKALSGAPNWALKSSGGTSPAAQRLGLLPRYFHACGLKGWVLLIDELEVLGRCGLRQRLAAYKVIGELVRIAGAAGSCLVPVFATTDGSYLEFIAEDESNVLAGLYYPDDSARDDAIVGLTVFKNVIALEKPDRAQISDIQYRVKTIYQAAYQTQVPDPRIDTELSGYQVRTQIRNWVTQWDLKRLYPTEQVSVETTDLTLDSSPLAEVLEVQDRELNE